MATQLMSQQDTALVHSVLKQVGRRIVGQEYMVERLLISLLTGGHVLLEGVPGLAKTLTVRTLAETIHTTFQRIQAAQRLNGQTPINGWLGFVLVLVFSPAFYGYMQSGLNSAWRATADAS